MASPIDIGLAGGEGGLAISPSSGASASASISAPFEAITGQGSKTEETPYLLIGLGAAVAILVYRMMK